MSDRKKKYRRQTHYPGHVAASVTQATQDVVEALADQAGWSIAETVRECIHCGLPIVQSRVTSSRNSLQAASVEKP